MKSKAKFDVAHECETKVKFRIGVDIDGVIADQVRGVLPLINQKLGTNYQFDDWNSWYFITEATGLDIREVLSFMEVSWEEELIPFMEEGIVETLKEIRKIGALTIISARTFKSHSKVIETLQRWGIDYDAIVLLTGKEEKQDYPLDVLIDDHPTIGYSEMPLIVIDQPWNQEIEQDWHTVRVDTVKDAIPWIKKFKEQRMYV